MERPAIDIDDFKAKMEGSTIQVGTVNVHGQASFGSNNTMNVRPMVSNSCSLGKYRCVYVADTCCF